MKRPAILFLTALLSSSTYAATPANDPVAKMLHDVDAKRIEQTIRTLVSFGTRNTLSSQSDPKRGIGAARDYLYGEFQKIAATSGGRMTVELQSFNQEAGKFPRIAKTTRLTNVVATLRGTQPESATRVYVISGHYDSMCSSPTDADCDAPGANDDASGTAAVLEAARVMAPHEFDATIVFMAVAGEEQGLVGATHFAEAAKEKQMDIEAMFTNDIVGNTRGGNGVVDRGRLRLFAEGVPSNETPEEATTRRSVGGENDSRSRELARFIYETAKSKLPEFKVWLMYRRDRYLRGGDHIPFLERGFPAVRFTETNEDYTHQHQNVRVENGVQYGDLPQFVDFAYIANVARVNVAALAGLALAPAPPHDAVVLTTRLTNDTDLQWSANREPDLDHYEIVWRDTTAPQWEHSQAIGNVTSYTAKGVSKDNYIFGIVAVDKQGHRSPASFPKPKRETPAPRAASAPEVKQRPDLDAELKAMRDADQKILREQVEKHDNTWREDDFKKQNRQQVARLREIFAELHGWPGKSITSVQGSGAAWTILALRSRGAARVPSDDGGGGEGGRAVVRTRRHEHRPRPPASRPEAALRLAVRHEGRQVRAATDRRSRARRRPPQSRRPRPARRLHEAALRVVPAETNLLEGLAPRRTDRDGQGRPGRPQPLDQGPVVRRVARRDESDGRKERRPPPRDHQGLRMARQFTGRPAGVSRRMGDRPARRKRVPPRNTAADEAAVDKGDMLAMDYALSVDRVRIQDGQKQLYGSQFTKEGKCEPQPIEDPEHVDERRKAMGLPPLAEYTKELCEMYGRK